MKRIAYLVTDHGIDGRAKESIVYASWDEQDAADYKARSKSGPWWSLTERIVDVEGERLGALQRAGAIGRLVLGLNNLTHTDP